MAYTETTTTSYGSRLGKSIGGIGMGFIMFIAGTCLLWWNEGRAVKTAKMLAEAQSVAVHVDNVNRLDPKLNGKLIHATAFADTKDSISDPDFGFGATAISLDRQVEYYQWEEHSSTQKRDKIGGGEEEVTTYTYKSVWTNAPINSGEFKDPQYQGKNSVLVQFDQGGWKATNVTFGAYKLPEFIINDIDGSVPIEAKIPELNLKTWNQQIAQTKGDQMQIEYTPQQQAAQQQTAQQQATKDTSAAAKNDSTATNTAAATTTTTENQITYKYVHPKGNVVYFGLAPGAPAIGDVRVTFTKIVPKTISLIAKVNGDTFEHFRAKNGKEFATVRSGTVSMEEIFQQENDQNSMWTWILRLGGLLLVIWGLKGIFDIFITIFKVLPFLANIVGLGVGLICGVVGFAWSLIIIAIAWLFYRPVLGIIILLCAGGLIYYLAKKGKKKNKAVKDAEAAPGKPEEAKAAATTLDDGAMPSDIINHKDEQQ